MAVVRVGCPECGRDRVVKRGRTPLGKQRYLCMNPECAKKTFILHYSYSGRLPETKAKIVDMALDGSGVRDTARVLGVSQATAIKELKKKRQPSSS